MFFEPLETRRMFAVTIAAKVVTTPAQLPSNLAPPPQLGAGNVANTGSSSNVAGVAQGVSDPSRLGNLGNVTLLDGITVSLDPTHRPGVGDVAGSGLRDLIGSLLGDSFLKNFAGRSISTDVIASADAASTQRDLFDVVGADLASMRGIYESARGDRTSQSSDGETEEKGIIDAIIEFFTGGDDDKGDDGKGQSGSENEKKTEGDYVADYLTSPSGYASDVATTKLGPPGPWSTLLNAPNYVETVTGDAKDLLNGFIAVVQSGDKDPRMPKGDQTPDPNGDQVNLSPQQQQAINQVLALMGKYLSNGPRALDQGTGLISQPPDDAIVRTKPDREQLPSERIFAGRLAPYINPGSGDDGSNVGGLGDATGTPPPVKATVKDPPKPDLVGTLPTVTGTPRNLPGGGTPSTSPDGTSPTAPAQPGK